MSRAAEDQAAAEREGILMRIAAEVESGVSQAGACTRAGISVATYWRWRKMFEGGGRAALRPGHERCGRRSVALSPDEIKGLRNIFIRTNRNRRDGSKTQAARMFAVSPECSEEVREAILKPRASKHILPQSVKDALVLPQPLKDFHRAPRRAALAGAYCPGGLRLARDSAEKRRLWAGERQSWDDGSINLVVWVPWPWGGCRCSDKFGVKVGRFQLLAGIDDASDFCPGFSYIMRPAQSYRAADVIGAQFRTWRDDVLPAAAVLEGGVWQASAAEGWHKRVGVEVIDAKGRPHMKLVENWWNRLWSQLSVQPGQIGRYRGEMERENALLVKAQAGRIDPRTVFPAMTAVMGATETSVAYLNSEPVESKKYGRWMPNLRYRDDLGEHPRPKLDMALAWAAAPEQHERVVTKGLVTVKVPGPLGFPIPYYFSAPELWEYQGVRVRVHFDAYDAPPIATITLAQDYAGLKAGHIITHKAFSLDDAPMILHLAEGVDIGFDEAGLSRAIQIRKAQAGALRTEYRALGFDGRRRAAASDIRDGRGNRAAADFDGSSTGSNPTESGTTPTSNRMEAFTRAPGERALPGAAGGQLDITTRRPEFDEAAELAQIDALERAARERGELWV